MNYVIDRTAAAPAYMQLYRQLRADIVSGALPLGAKLPSKRTLSEELGVSLITVEHALALLTDEGYTETRPRSGAYVSFGGERRRETPVPAPAQESATPEVYVEAAEQPAEDVDVIADLLNYFLGAGEQEEAAPEQNENAESPANAGDDEHNGDEDADDGDTEYSGADAGTDGGDAEG